MVTVLQGEPGGLVLPGAVRRRGGIIELYSRGARRLGEREAQGENSPLERRFGAVMPPGAVAVAKGTESAIPCI